MVNRFRVRVRHAAHNGFHHIHGLGDLAHHILADAAIYTIKAAKVANVLKVVFA